MIPNLKGDKLMGKVKKCVRYDEKSMGKGNYNSILLGKVKNGRYGQTHAHAIFWSCTYMRLSSVRPMDASAFTSYLQQLYLSALWNIHLEAKTFVLVWIYMTTSLMMMNRVLLMVAPTRRDIKGLQIPLR